MAAYQGPIVDVDVHHRPKSDAELIAYLPARWRDYAQANPRKLANLRPPAPSGAMLNNSGMRADSFPPDGSPPGSSYEMTRSQLLDAYPYAKALLTHDVGEFAMLGNPYFALELCRATNDWTIDAWLAQDGRLAAAITVPAALPEQAAAEIHRLADHPGTAAVLIAGNPLGRPLGDPLYHPIYRAAAEHGLAVAIHSGPAAPNGEFRTIGGPKATGIESLSQAAQPAMSFISSFVSHGVFEQYPDLQVIIIEFGVAWLPSLLWRLDERYELLRLESPWVKRWPSEYVRSNIRLSTQPIEVGADPRGIVDLMSTIDGVEDLLCYSTDYPHGSMDAPEYMARILPEAWHAKVFCDNACRALGWRVPEAAQPVTVNTG